MSCIFCRTVAGEIPPSGRAEPEVSGFLDVQPLADGTAGRCRGRMRRASRT